MINFYCLQERGRKAQCGSGALVHLLKSLLPFGCCLLCGTLASAQSIYVDLDIGIGGPGVGAGAPSAAFGGAADVPGYWNRVVENPWNLRDTSGNLTNAVITWNGSGGSFGYNNPSISGDYKLLMSDALSVGAGGLNITVAGLQPGSYKVFTYACKPQGEAWTTLLSVPGSTSQNPQAVTGPMPVNQFILGVTHSVHDVQLGGSPLVIHADEHQNSYVNGFQILAVPEPTTSFAFAALVTVTLALRRKRM